MHKRETRVLLRHYLEQGVGKSELAKRFGIIRLSDNTHPRMTACGHYHLGGPGRRI
jgi:hypothetical protein